MMGVHNTLNRSFDKSLQPGSARMQHFVKRQLALVSGLQPGNSIIRSFVVNHARGYTQCRYCTYGEPFIKYRLQRCRVITTADEEFLDYSMKSTNYENTLIEVAEDCKVKEGEIPPYRGVKKSVANYEYEIIFNNPYEYTSDEVKFRIHTTRNEIPKIEQKMEKDRYFSKGQPCFRASPLPKGYGWGVHSNEKGKIAIYGIETNEYSKLVNDASIVKIKAMRSKKV